MAIEDRDSRSVNILCTHLRGCDIAKHGCDEHEGIAVRTINWKLLRVDLQIHHPKISLDGQ